MTTELAFMPTIAGLAKIPNDVVYAQVAEARELERQFIRAVETELGPQRDSAHRLHKEIVAKIKAMQAPHEANVKACDALLEPYHAEQERAKTALLESERVRVAQEQGAIAEQAAKKEAVGDFAGARESYLDMAGKGDELARTEKDLRATPQAPVVIQTYYSMVVVDSALVPYKYKTIDVARLNAQARVDKDDFDVPGCKLVKETRAKGSGRG